MGLSAVSELPEVSTISDQDLLMVSHTNDGVNYTSNKLTYGALEESVLGTQSGGYSLPHIVGSGSFKFDSTSNYRVNSDLLITEEFAYLLKERALLIVNGVEYYVRDAYDSVQYATRYSGATASTYRFAVRFYVKKGDVVTVPSTTTLYYSVLEADGILGGYSINLSTLMASIDSGTVPTEL